MKKWVSVLLRCIRAVIRIILGEKNNFLGEKK